MSSPAPSASEDEEVVHDLTILSCSDTDDADRLFHFLADWAQSGMLDADLWLLSGSADGDLWPARPISFVDENHAAVREELSSALAARRYGIVRIVNVALTGGSGLRSAEAVASVRDYVRERIPANLVRLVTMNIAVPTSRVRPDAPDAAGLASAADLNIVVTPEDQRSSHHPWQAFESREQYAGWAACVVATAAGLWAGVSRGPLDDHSDQLIQGEPAGMVGRAFVRLIDGGFLVDHIGAGLVGRFEEWPVPSGIRRAENLVEQRPEAVDHLAQQFLDVDDHALRFNRVPEKQKPPRQEMVWWRAFLLMFRFIFDALRQVPTNFIRGLQHKVRTGAARWVQSVTMGDDSDVVVTFGGWRSDDQLAGRPHTPEDIRNQARQIVSLMGDRNPPPTSPKAWFDLRKLVFGLADGSELPSVVDQGLVHEGDRRLLVRSPSHLGPDPSGAPLVLHESLFAPGEPLEGLAGRVARPCDALLCREMDTLLARAIAMDDGPSGPSAVADLDVPATDAEAEIDSDEEAGSDDGDEEVEAVDAVVPPVVLPSDRVRYTQARGAIRDWVMERKDSLLWRLGDGIARELLMAIEEYIRAMAVIAAHRPSSVAEEMRRLRRRLWLRWLLIALLVAAGVGVGWLVLGISLLVAAAIALPTLIVSWFATFFRFSREMFRLQYRDLEQRMAYEHAEDSAWVSAGEIVKLVDRYVEFLDWSEVIGHFVHRPWGNPTAIQPAASTLDRTDVPRALGTAQGYITQQSVRSMRARALRQIITTGWLTSLFSPIRDEVLEQLRVDLGLDDASEVIDPEADSGHGHEAPRQRLLRHFDNGRYSASSRRHYEDKVIAFCRALTPSQAFEYVRVDLRPGDEPVRAHEQPPTTAATHDAVHLEPIPTTRSGGGLDAREVVRSSLDAVVHLRVEEGTNSITGSGVLLRHDGHLVTNAHVVGAADEVTVEFTDGVATTGRVVSRAPEQDLAIVHVGRTDVVAARPAADAVSIGQPVVAIGNPSGLAGGPSVSLGIVSAVGRNARFPDHTLHGLIQTDATIGHGSSGGGLFDENGSLVGITTAGLDSVSIGFAISVDDVVRYLNDVVHGGDGDQEEDEEGGDGEIAGVGADQVRVGMTYDDVDEFLIEILPQPGDTFGASCWRPEDQPKSKADRSFLWHPPDHEGRWPEGDDVVSMTVVQPRVSLGRKLAFAACRLDLSSIGLAKNFPILGPASSGDGDGRQGGGSTDGRSSGVDATTDLTL